MTWVAAGVASGMATAAGVRYVKAKMDAKKDEKNRPQYQIPEEVKANMTQADQMALQGLPEEQKQQFANNIQRSQAFGLSQMGNRKAGLTGLAAVNQQGIDAYGNLMSADAQARQQNQLLQMQQRQVLADYKDQQSQLNKINPYYENMRRREARNDALAQNLINAGGTFLGGFGGGGKSASQAPQQQQSSQQGLGAGDVDYSQFGNRTNRGTMEDINNYDPNKPFDSSELNKWGKF